MLMRWLGVALVAILVLLFTSCSAPARLSNYCKSDYTAYVLIGDPSARDIGYTELLDFLDTFKPEVLPTKSCGHYAEDLHNYAESQSIRCAVVVSRLPESNHAFNGFRTDGTMTYVDAGAGVIAIATKDGTGLKFVKDFGDSIGTQTVGQERDFLIFWEGD